MGKYAAGTAVTPTQSRVQIENLLNGWGCSQVVVGYDADRAMIGFVRHGLAVRLALPMPDPSADEFRKTPTGLERDERAAREFFGKEVRRRWRSLHLVIKAKIAGIEDGITTMEREFLSDLVLPSGRTVLEEGGGPLRDALEGAAVSLLPATT